MTYFDFVRKRQTKKSLVVIDSSIISVLTQRIILSGFILGFTLKSSQKNTSLWIWDSCDGASPEIHSHSKWLRMKKKKKKKVPLLSWRPIWCDICSLDVFSSLCHQRVLCFLPGCPPSVTLISPFNYWCYQPPNASLSPLGISGNRSEMGRECWEWWQARGSWGRLWGDRGL